MERTSACSMMNGDNWIETEHRFHGDQHYSEETPSATIQIWSQDYHVIMHTEGCEEEMDTSSTKLRYAFPAISV